MGYGNIKDTPSWTIGAASFEIGFSLADVGVVVRTPYRQSSRSLYLLISAQSAGAFMFPLYRSSRYINIAYIYSLFVCLCATSSLVFPRFRICNDDQKSLR